MKLRAPSLLLRCALHPTVVTAGFTTGFVSALSVANAGGRVGWAGASDAIGSKNTMYALNFALPACLAVPQVARERRPRVPPPPIEAPIRETAAGLTTSARACWFFARRRSRAPP